MSEVKAREFWLYEAENKLGEKYMCDIADTSPKDESAIHVIEYSAYAAVCAERDELRSALEKIRNEFPDTYLKYFVRGLKNPASKDDVTLIIEVEK